MPNPLIRLACSAMVAAAGISSASAAFADTASPKKASVILVHGAFVDGSGWKGVGHLEKPVAFDGLR